jgi:hypothetical protein
MFLDEVQGCRRVRDVIVGNENKSGRDFWISQGFEAISEATLFGRDIL